MDKLERTNALDRTLDFNSQALQLRARRQGVLAANIANADTPGFKAQDFDFATALKQATSEPSGTQAAAGKRGAAADVIELKARASAQPSVDENTVDLDQERTEFADNAIRYEAALRTLNGQIKTMLSAIQG
jgi:flagellar basal-body rod protein FlgB